MCTKVLLVKATYQQYGRDCAILRLYEYDIPDLRHADWLCGLLRLPVVRAQDIWEYQG